MSHPLMRLLALTTVIVVSFASPIIMAQPIPPPRECGDAVQAVDDLRQELNTNVERVQRGLDRGRAGLWKNFHDIAEYACQLGDRTVLDIVFQRCIRECVDTADRYVAAVDYASALERFGDPQAELYYRRAIEMQPNHPDAYEAYFRYSIYLERLGRTQQALDLWNEFSADDLRERPSAAAQKLRLMEELGMDTSEAERELRILPGRPTQIR